MSAKDNLKKCQKCQLNYAAEGQDYCTLCEQQLKGSTNPKPRETVASARLPECTGKKVKLFQTGEILYIHRCDARLLYCNNRRHNVVPATGIVLGLDGNQYAISISHCTDCDTYFISHIDYKLYIDRLGFILTPFSSYEKEDSHRGSSIHQLEFNDVSPLSLMGYSVEKKNGKPAAVRKAFLATVIDKNILNKSTIQNYLRQFLTVNSQREGMEYARQEWESDLLFINEYNKDSQQPQVFIDTISKWQNCRPRKMTPYRIGVDTTDIIIGDESLPYERRLCDHKTGNVKLVSQGNKENVLLFVENYLAKDSLSFLYSHGWQRDKQLKCWRHADKDSAYRLACSFLDGLTRK